ncbi:MAG: hypothetical protein ACW99E_10975 [Promethearchaeota archaeon]|jgi:hypothetical protein
MNLDVFLIIAVSWFGILIFSTVNFFRRISRSFRRVARRVQNRVRRVTRYQRKFAKTDPKIFNSIKSASSQVMKNTLDRKGSQWVNEKKLKREVKNKVAIQIEEDLQKSPMKDMRTLVDKTMDEFIDLSFLREVKNRGDRIRITTGSLIGSIFWRLLFPITTALAIGWASYAYPDRIPPGNLVIPPNPQFPTGAPAPIDPIPLLQSALINGAIYGVGALTIVGIILLFKRR